VEARYCYVAYLTSYYIGLEKYNNELMTKISTTLITLLTLPLKLEHIYHISPAWKKQANKNKNKKYYTPSQVGTAWSTQYKDLYIYIYLHEPTHKQAVIAQKANSDREKLQRRSKTR
jgi:hypothetical protein